MKNVKFIFIGITILLIVVHIQKVHYLFDSESGSSKIILYDNEFVITSNVNTDGLNRINVKLTFSEIKSRFQVLNLDVTSNSLVLNSIKPYSGKQFEAFKKYHTFNSIPDSLKLISIDSNPYYAFDFLFDNEVLNDDFTLNISAKIIVKGNNVDIDKQFDIKRSSKFELEPLDAHSDISFLLIYPFGIISLILIGTMMLKKKKIK